MTATAPFPPALETAITEALALHNRLGFDRTVNQSVCDGCGARIIGGLSRALAAHQWEVLSEVIAQHTTTEWGRERPTNFRGGRRYVSPTAHRPASVEWDETLVARLVLPWQEVKA